MTISLLWPIVEGFGELEAVPALLRRMTGELFDRYDVIIGKPFRLPRTKMDNDFELRRMVLAADTKIKQSGREGAIIILFDADDDLCCEIGPRIRSKAESFGVVSAVRVIVANREYESWFLAAIRSLSGYRRVRDDAEPPEAPESARDAKGCLQGKYMAENATYSPTIDQAPLTLRMNLHDARNGSPSFDKLCRDIEGLLIPSVSDDRDG